MVAPGTGTPTGTVAFKEGSTTLDTETLGSTGIVSFTTSALGVGSDTITAVYSGDPNFVTSSSSTTEPVSQASTNTGIAANPTSSAYGQSVTFTASVSVVSPGGGTPTGTVAFKEGSTTLDTETLGSTGIVSFTTSALGVGSDTITAVYSGDPNFVTSSSSTTESVGQASTSTSITANPSSSVYGQSVTFTASVTVTAPGGGTPTGTVAFKEGSTTLDSETLGSTGTVSFTTSALAIGSDTITAVYSGDPNFVTSSSSTTETVSQASTNTAITANPTSSVYGQSVTFTASVSVVAPGGGTPTGTVAFKEGSTTLDTENLGPSGTVSFTTSALGVGSDAITAVYSGDPNFMTSSSSTTESVSQASTNTAITANPTASSYGQSVTFTATVTVVAPGTGTPTGTVAFKEGSTTLDTETLGSTGTVSFTTSALAVGSDTITAVYSGDPNFVTSSSSTTETVSQASTNTTITANPTASVYGQSVTFTASVAVVSPGAGTPTGTVAFKEGSTTLDTVTLGTTRDRQLHYRGPRRRVRHDHRGLQRRPQLPDRLLIHHRIRQPGRHNDGTLNLKYFFDRRPDGHFDGNYRGGCPRRGGTNWASGVLRRFNLAREIQSDRKRRPVQYLDVGGRHAARSPPSISVTPISARVPRRLSPWMSVRLSP